MMDKQDREGILEGLRALTRVCLRIEKESVHCEQITINDRRFTVTWMLGFDSELQAFESSVSVIPEVAGEGGKIYARCVALENYLQDRFDGLKDHEAWPSELPSSWLAGVAEILPPLSADSVSPDNL